MISLVQCTRVEFRFASQDRFYGYDFKVFEGFEPNSLKKLENGTRKVSLLTVTYLTYDRYRVLTKGRFIAKDSRATLKVFLERVPKNSLDNVSTR